MDEDFLAWARRQRDHWITLIPMLKGGQMGRHELHNGKTVDTTAQAIDEISGRLAELEALLSRYEPAGGRVRVGEE